MMVLGTIEMKCKDISHSNTLKPADELQVSQTTIGFSYFVTGSVTFAIGKNNGSFQSGTPKWYNGILDSASQTHIILQDMDEKNRRAWHTNGERLILQTILHRHLLKAYTVDGATIDLQAADPNDPDSVRVAMHNNAQKVLEHDQDTESNEIKSVMFKTLVAELYTILDGLQSILGSLKDHTKAMLKIHLDLKRPQRPRILGWEYMDLVGRKARMDMKEGFLSKSCGIWPHFASDIGAVILFGNGFQEIIEPRREAALCPSYESVPTGMDLLTIESQVIKSMFEDSGTISKLEHLTRTGLRWHRSTQVFEDCCLNEECTCDRIQQFEPKNSLSKVILPLGFDIQTTGAVIFGRSAKRSQNVLLRQNSSGNSASHVQDVPIGTQSRRESQAHSIYGVHNVDISTLLATQPESSASATVQRPPTAQTTCELPLTHALRSAPLDRRQQGPRLQNSHIPRRTSALRNANGSFTSSFVLTRDKQYENTEPGNQQQPPMSQERSPRHL
jgi:hypothetical protein